MQKGYAVAVCGAAHKEVLINTVASTRRAAIVNYLMAERGVPVFALATDDEIEYLYSVSKLHNDNVIEVDIGEHKQYVVGEQTVKLVFGAQNLTNLSDMQAVLDSVEEALKNIKEACVH